MAKSRFVHPVQPLLGWTCTLQALSMYVMYGQGRLDSIFLTQGMVILKPTTCRLQEVFEINQTIKKLGSRTFGEVYLGVVLVSGSGGHQT